MNRAARKRVVFWAGVIVVMVAGLLLSLRTSPLPVDVTAASRGPLRVTLDHEGRTRVRERYTVSAPVGGRVLRIEIEPGDAVAAGRTVLARILPGAPALLDARARAGAEAQVQVAAANLERARAQRDQAREASDFARSEAERTRGLYADGLATSQQRDTADADARVKASAVDAAVAAVEAAARDLDAARAALYEGGPGAAGRLVEVRAPVTGVLLRRLRESESVVAQGEPLVEVADPADLEIVADYLSSDAVQIRPGMPVVVEGWGGGAALNARVTRVEPSGFMKISALGVEEQRVWVVMAFTDPPAAWAALGDGYRVEARVIVWQQPEVLKVAVGSLFRDGTAWAVFVVDGGVARLRTVTLGQRNDVEAEVTGGLEAGSTVVAYPSDQVQDGARVEPRR
jgi:HlyD family secretion protein